MEIFGIIGTLLILVAFTRNGELKIRVLDLLGAIFFVIYGITIRSLSTLLLNGALILVQVYKIVKLRKEKIV